MKANTVSQIKSTLAAEVDELVANFVELLLDPSHKDEEVLRYALRMVREEDGFRVTSRSTSVIDNLVGDVRRSVAFAIADALTEWIANPGKETAAAHVQREMRFRAMEIVR